MDNTENSRIKYLEDGSKVYLYETTPSGYIVSHYVQTVSDIKEFVSSLKKVVKEVYNEPVIQIYANEIMELQEVIKTLKIELKDYQERKQRLESKIRFFNQIIDQVGDIKEDLITLNSKTLEDY